MLLVVLNFVFHTLLFIVLVLIFSSELRIKPYVLGYSSILPQNYIPSSKFYFIFYLFLCVCVGAYSYIHMSACMCADDSGGYTSTLGVTPQDLALETGSLASFRLSY